MNDIFAFGKNDIALRATIFTLRVNGGSFGECPLPPYPAERGATRADLARPVSALTGYAVTRGFLLVSEEGGLRRG